MVISALSKPQIGFNGLGSPFNNNLITQYNYGYQVEYLQYNIINVRARQPFQPHFQPHYQPQFLLHFQPSVLPTFPPYPFIPQIQPFIPQSRFFQPKTLNYTTSLNNNDSDVVPEIVAKLTPFIEETILNSINGPEPPSGSGQRK